MNTPQKEVSQTENEAKLITAYDLLEALEEKRAEFKSEERWNIIAEIARARHYMEQYNEGGLGESVRALHGGTS